MNKILTLSLSVLASAALYASQRVVTPFNDGWTVDGKPVTLPHTWNAQDGADGATDAVRNERYLAWQVNPASSEHAYERKAVAYKNVLPNPKPGRRYFFRCKGASVTAEVYVNNILIGRHLGAYTAFCYEVTDLLKEQGNKILVYVDNSFNRDIPTLSADFTIFGGLYRGCELIETDAVCIDPTYYGGSGVELKVDPKRGHVTAKVHVLGGPDETREFDFPDFELWSPENPKLYSVDIELANGDKVTETFGFRTAGFDADGNFVLNGKVLHLRGVNRHQDRKDKGWAISAADEEEDIRLIKEMGANAIRTAHYPQSKSFYDLMDQEGFIGWCETPVTDTISPSAAYRATLAEMCREMVVQLGAHPSICMWSLFNELQNGWAPKLPAKTVVGVLKMEQQLFNELDGTRPTVAAFCSPSELEINAVPDAIAYNTYPGWYWKTADCMASAVESACRTNSRTKIAVSEYGAGANVAHHEWPSKKVVARGPFHPEENQLIQHIGQYECIYANDRVWGTFIWNMFDFAADTRNEGGTPGMNDKGLVTYDRKTKKDVYYFYQANWTKTPVLRLVGTRLGTLTKKRVPLLVISNVGAVTLKVNGKVIGTKSPDELKRVWFNDVQLVDGSNAIEITAGEEKVEADWWCVAVSGSAYEKD